MKTNKVTKIKRVSHPIDDSVFISFFCFLIKMVLVVFVSIPLTISIGLFKPIFLILKYTILILKYPISSVSTLCKPLQYLNAHEAQYLYKEQKDLAIFQSILILNSSMNLESIREIVTSRIIESRSKEEILLYPRFSQKLVFTSLGPAWLKEESFDIKNHIYSGPPIHKERDLLKYVTSLMTQSLSFNIPLWEVIVIVDYEDEHDVVLIFRTHKCLTDGIALVKLLCESLVDNSSGSILKKPHFAGTVFGFNLLRGMLLGVLTTINWLWWGRPSSELWVKSFTKKSSSRVSFNESKLHKNKDTVINISNKDLKSSLIKKREENPSGYVVTWSDSVQVNDVLRIKQITRTTFNDVILSALTGALRKTIQKYGQTVINNTKANVAIDLRKNKNLQDQKLEAKMSLVPIEVPLSCEGAVPRIWEVQKRMRTMKGSCDSVVGYWLACLLPQSMAVSLLYRLQHQVPISYSSIGVPAHPISIGSSRVKAVFAIAPTASALNTTVVSYFGRVYVTVAIKQSIPQASKLASRILQNFENEMFQLADQMSRRRLPRTHKGNGQLKANMSGSSATATLQGLDGSIHNTNIKHLEEKLLLVQQEMLALKTAAEAQVIDKNNLNTVSQEDEHLQLDEDISLKVLNLKNEFTAILSEINRQKNKNKNKV